MTTDNELDREAQKLAQRAGERLRASADQLDAATLSRLNQARQRALEELPGQRVQWPWRWLMPAGSLAIAALVAVFVLQQPLQTTVDPIPVAHDMSEDQAVDFELLMGEDDLEMIEDLEFFAWLSVEELEAAG